MFAWVISIEEAESMSDYEIFELDAVRLQSGLTLRPAKLTYKTYGELNAARDNVIMMPTFYGGQHAENEAMITVWRTLTRRSTSSSCPICLGTGLILAQQHPAPV